MSLTSFTNYFKPYQPEINHPFVHQIEIEPPSLLKDYILCYFTLFTTKPLEDTFEHTIIADGCIDVLWDASLPNDHLIMGSGLNHRVTPMTGSFRFVGARFYPGIIPSFTDLDASKVTDKVMLLKRVLPSWFHALKAYDFVSSPFEVCQTYFTDTFSELISDFKMDTRVATAMKTILSKNGIVNINSDFEYEISARHLRRLFKKSVGLSLKSFSRIVRFHEVIKTNLGQESPASNWLMNDYYDQSHLIKDFKQISGKTPKRR